MARRPLSQFADQDDLLSEEAQYVLRESKQWCQMLTTQVESITETVQALQHALQLMATLESIKDMTSSVNILSQKVESTKEALTALAEKLDAEDVTNLDTNYTAEIAGILT